MREGQNFYQNCSENKLVSFTNSLQVGKREGYVHAQAAPDRPFVRPGGFRPVTGHAVRWHHSLPPLHVGGGALPQHGRHQVRGVITEGHHHGCLQAPGAGDWCPWPSSLLLQPPTSTSGQDRR